MINFFKRITHQLIADMGINLIVTGMLAMEMLLPIKVIMKEPKKDIIKYKFPELTLSADQYEFNGKYLPFEIVNEGKYEIKYTKFVSATAYSSTIDQTDGNPFVAASGKRVHDGMVAANFLKFGTKLRIPEHYGEKIFIIEDRMNKRFFERIDIWMNTREEAIKFGVKKVKIEILED